MHQAQPYTMAEILAENTHLARTLYAREIAKDLWAQETDPNCIAPSGLAMAENRYMSALRQEIQVIDCPRTSRGIRETTKDAAARARLAVRGTARVSAGIVIGIAWGAALGDVLTDRQINQLGDLALGTCYEGGRTDIKRAVSPRHEALSLKRCYQLYMEIRRASVLLQNEAAQHEVPG
jgi:hypothetical protein